jgi:hypothetical protein
MNSSGRVAGEVGAASLPLHDLTSGSPAAPLFPQESTAAGGCWTFPFPRSLLDLKLPMTDGLAAVNYLRLVIQICKGLIRSHQVRRTIMFWDVLVVLVLAFVGSTFLWNWLRSNPFWFLVYWAVCGWLTILAAVLAVYDMIRVRLEGRHAEDRLREKYFPGKDDSDDSHDSHSH